VAGPVFASLAPFSPSGRDWRGSAADLIRAITSSPPAPRPSRRGSGRSAIRPGSTPPIRPGIPMTWLADRSAAGTSARVPNLAGPPDASRPTFAMTDQLLLCLWIEGMAAVPSRPASLDLVAGSLPAIREGIRRASRDAEKALPVSPRHDFFFPDVWHEKPEPEIVAAVVDVAPEGEELDPPRRF